MTFLKKAKFIIGIVFAIMTLLNFPLHVKTDYDVDAAKALIEEAYRPMMIFVEDLEPTEDEDWLLVPDYVKSEEAFDAFIGANMKSYNGNSLYEEWIIEENGVLYANSNLYIPIIYGPQAEVYKSYVRTRQSIINLILKRGNDYTIENDYKIELIIKEQSKTDEDSGGYLKRVYYFEKDDGKRWRLDHVDGVSLYKFVNPPNNPWFRIWSEEEPADASNY